MKFSVYGIEIHCPIAIQHSIPLVEGSDEVLMLEIVNNPHQLGDFTYHTPTIQLHGREVQLSSTHSLFSSRLMAERCWKIEVGELFIFTWCNNSNSMYLYSKNKIDTDKLLFWLLHTVIPVYLILQEASVFLHASSVDVEGKAVLFLAPSFGGKSTLADFFLTHKHPLLSDDKVRLLFRKGEYFAYPSYPYRRAHREVETLGDYTDNFANTSLPIGNVYVLNSIEPIGDCGIERIVGLEKFEMLKSAYLYEPVSLSEIEMRHLMNLMVHSNVYGVSVPKEIARLQEVYQIIMNHATNKECNV